MAQYPRCPHCNTILPEFGPREKKICPNCEKKITSVGDPGTDSSIVKTLLRKYRIWLILIAVSVIFTACTDGILGAVVALMIEGIFAYALCTFSRNKIIRAHFKHTVNRTNPRDAELATRKYQLRYYGKATVTYLVVATLAFALLVIIQLVSPSEKMRPVEYIILAPLSMAIFFTAWNFLAFLLRSITLHWNLPTDSQCTHTPVSEPFSTKRKKKVDFTLGKFSIFFFSIWLVIGIVIIPSAAKELTLRKKYPEKYPQISAQITNIQKSYDEDGDAEHTVFVSYSYKNTEYKNKELSYYNSKMKTGDTIEIFIEADHPENIGNDADSDLTMGIVFSVIGLVGIVVVLLIGKRLRKQ